MKLKVLSGTYAVCRMAADAEVVVRPGAEFLSVTRTADEVSVVCEQDHVPMGSSVEGDWKALRVAGAIPFATVGLLASMTSAVAAAGVSVFAVSTFDTDYLLAKRTDWPKVVAALEAAGFEFQD